MLNMRWRSDKSGETSRLEKPGRIRRHAGIKKYIRKSVDQTIEEEGARTFAYNERLQMYGGMETKIAVA